MQNVLGVQLYTVREFTQTLEGFEESIKKLAGIGYTAVQISGVGPMDPEDIAKVCRDHGVAIVGTHFGWADFCGKSDEIIAKHKAWDCSHTAVGVLPPEYFNDGLAGIRKFMDELGPVLEKLNKEGIDFSYHNHFHEFVKVEGKTFLEWIYELGGENLLPEIDTYWIQAGGEDPAKWIRKFPNRQPLLHLKDMSLYRDTTKFLGECEQRLAPVGEGNLDWDDILQAAAESNCRWYLVEQDNCYGRDPFDCLASSYRFLSSKGLC